MDLLEIRLIVGSFLDSHDLFSCIRVSKLWHRSFLPFIYTRADSQLLHRHWGSFRPQLCHVRDVSITPIATPEENEGILRLCRRLIRLSFQSDPSSLDYLIQLLQRNPQLVRFTLSIHGRARDPKLWKTLVEYCPRLTELDLHSIDFQGESLIGFMSLAPRITTLKLRDCNLSNLLAWMSSSLPASAGSEAHSSDVNISGDNDNIVLWENDWPGFPTLRELSISGYHSDSTWMQQLQLFVQAPKLEILSWNILHVELPDIRSIDRVFVSTLIRILRQGTWPQLNSLEVTVDMLGQWSSLNDNRLAEILNLFPGCLKSFRIPGADFGLEAWQAIQRHLETLQVLQLTKVPSWMVQGFLTSCPELRELRGPTLNTWELVRGIGPDLARQRNEKSVAVLLAQKGLPQALMAQLRQAEASTIADIKDLNGSDLTPSYTLPEVQFPLPWACHRLRVLQIILVRISLQWAREKKETDSQVFQQLRQMRYLEELSLCPMEDAHHTIHGLSPCQALGMKLKHPKFRGEFNSVVKIRNHPVGEQLLKIWPGLTSCYWQTL